MTKELQIDDRLVTLQVGFLAIDIVKNVLWNYAFTRMCLCSGLVDMGYGRSREIPESWSCIL